MDTCQLIHVQFNNFVSFSFQSQIVSITVMPGTNEISLCPTLCRGAWEPTNGSVSQTRDLYVHVYVVMYYVRVLSSGGGRGKLPPKTSSFSPCILL